jgi:hypothetical protein
MGVFSYLSSCEGLTSLQKIGESMVESFRKEEEVTRATRYRSETRSKLRRLPDKFLERRDILSVGGYRGSEIHHNRLARNNSSLIGKIHSTELRSDWIPLIFGSGERIHSLS